MNKQKLIALAAVTLCCSFALGADWLTDGSTATRNGRQKDEHAITNEDIKNV